MKQYSFTLIIAYAAASLFFFTGCPMSVGKCTYGSRPAQRGAVVIKSAEKIYSNNQFFYRVHVEGFFKRDFIYTEDEFNRKFTSKGYKTGSQVEGTILSGGPCPPVFTIAE